MKKPYIKVLIGVAAILVAVLVAVIALWPHDSGDSHKVGTLYNPSTTATRLPNGTTARPAATTTQSTTTTTVATTTTTTAITTAGAA